jgi:SNF2 family DNA or RNA helicase
VSYLLSNLAARRSVILGDEMGLGKTCQTVVFLQVRSCQDAGWLASQAA